MQVVWVEGDRNSLPARPRRDVANEVTPARETTNEDSHGGFELRIRSGR